MKLIIVVSLLAILSIILFAIIVFLILMENHRKVISRYKDFVLNDIILDRYLLWFSSYIAWTIIEYGLLLAQIIIAMFTIYFTVDSISNKNSQNVSLSVMSIMVFLSAVLPLINLNIKPKKRSNGYYKGFVTLEQAIFKYQLKLINVREFLELEAKAEEYTNSVNLEDL